MTYNKVIKEIGKLQSEREGDFPTRDVFLLSDSKGRYLQDQVHASDTIKINFIYRGGFVINNPEFRLSLHRIRSSRNPIVLIWLGTCEFTNKCKNSQITLKTEVCFDSLIHQYEKFKADILTFQRSAEVYFIETSPIYISEWNKILGHGEEEGLDQALYEKILVFNARLKELNSPLSPPSISQDLVQSSKKSTQHKTNYKINGHLYLDGIHPGDELAELWLLRLYKFIRRVVAQ